MTALYPDSSCVTSVSRTVQTQSLEGPAWVPRWPISWDLNQPRRRLCKHGQLVSYSEIQCLTRTLPCPDLFGPPRVCHVN